MRSETFPPRDFRIVSRNPKLDLLDRWISMSPEKRSRTYVDTARAARIAGMSRRTILNWIHAGCIISLQIGKKHQILLRSLKTHICSATIFEK